MVRFVEEHRSLYIEISALCLPLCLAITASTFSDSVAGECPPSICVSCMQTFLSLVMDLKACKGGHFPPTYIELRLMVGWNVSPSQARQNPSKDSLDFGGRRASPSVETRTSCC
jgi:hypothetical protein